MSSSISPADQAESLFKSGFSCSQAVLAAFAPGLGLDRSLALKIAQPYGGGTAHTGRMCGAAAGALLVIGLKFGRTEPEDTGARDKTYALVHRFLDLFREKHGGLDCPELLGYDLAVPAEMEKAVEEGLFDTLCNSLVRSAAEILQDIL
jgi:C_GCAxxG_C_C family probable redox protein